MCRTMKGIGRPVRSLPVLPSTLGHSVVHAWTPFALRGFWSGRVGNGWAAAGMLRVLGTMQNSQFAKSFKDEMSDLTSWVLDIQKAMYANIVRAVLLLYPPSTIAPHSLHLFSTHLNAGIR